LLAWDIRSQDWCRCHRAHVEFDGWALSLEFAHEVQVTFWTHEDFRLGAIVGPLDAWKSETWAAVSAAWSGRGHGSIRHLKHTAYGAPCQYLGTTVYKVFWGLLCEVMGNVGVCGFFEGGSWGRRVYFFPNHPPPSKLLELYALPESSKLPEHWCSSQSTELS